MTTYVYVYVLRGYIKTFSAKTNFDLAKDKYFRLLEQADENDTLIEDNKKKIEQQERLVVFGNISFL